MSKIVFSGLRILGILFGIVTLMSLNPTRSTRANAAGSFVGRSGSHFTLNGQTWYVAGTNNHYLGWGSQAEVDHVLNDAQAMHFNVVRSILHSVRGSLDGTTVPTKWNWASTGDTGNMGMHGVYILYWDPAAQKMAYNDSTTDGLGRWDYVIWKAGQLGLKLDISLLDFWQWAGGVQQINANFKGGNYDISNAPDRYTFFFQDAGAKQFYKDWMNHVLNRVNTLTGIAYKNDPTIFAWDLMNEPEIGGTTLGQSWISEMASYFKSLNSNQLLATGNEGFADAHAGTSVVLDVTNQPNIDFATWHTYPDYHGITPAQVITLIDQNCAAGATGGKPVIMQEFGYSSAHSDQASVYQSWMDELYNKDCAGWTFWRLTSTEDAGGYPPDNGEGFEIHNDGSASATVFINAEIRSLNRNQPMPTNTPCTACTATPTLTQTLTVAPTITNTPAPTNTPTPQPFTTFVKGVNINGGPVTIEGNAWLDYTSALAQGLSQTGGVFDTKSLTPNPTTDSDMTSMLNTLLYSSTDPGTISLAQTIANGSYQVYLWDMENYKANSRSFNLILEGTQVATGLGNLPLNGWARYGPYSVTVTDGVLNMDLVSTQGCAMIMGFAIFSNSSTGPTNTPTSYIGTPTSRPPTNTPAGPTATRTNTPVAPTATRTNTPVPATATRTPVLPTSTPGTGGHTNIAPAGTGYTWYNITASYAGNQRNEVGVNNGNLTQDFSLTGGGDDNQASDEAAGVIWSAAQTITSVKYINGTCDQYQNAPFTGNLRVQFTTNGSTWTTDTSWTVSPAYPYDSCSAGGQTYTFSGTAKTGVKGVRVIGTVHTTNASLSWHAIGKEVQVFN